MPAHKKPDLPRGAGIYRIVNLANGKCYVGSARNLAGRWRGHLCDLRLGKHHSVLLQRAWTKYGAASFKFEVLERVADLMSLVAREQSHLDALRPYDPALGYNIQPLAQSSLGRVVPMERRIRIAAALTGRKMNLSEEARAARAAAWRGRKHTAAALERMRASKLGKPLTEECKRKISETKRAAPASEALKRAHAMNAKVNPGQRPDVVKLRAAGLRLSDIAAQFNVSVPTVHRILAMQKVP